MKKIVNRLAVKGVIMKGKLKRKLENAAAISHEGVDGVVVALILVVVAVGAAILFREQILGTISTMMSQTNTEISKMFGSTIS